MPEEAAPDVQPQHSPGAFASPSSSSSVPLPEMHLPSKKLHFGTLPGQRCVFQVCSRLQAPARAVDPPTRTPGTSGRAFYSAADGNQPLVLPATAGHDGLISSTSSAQTHDIGGQFEASHLTAAPNPSAWPQLARSTGKSRERRQLERRCRARPAACAERPGHYFISRPHNYFNVGLGCKNKNIHKSIWNYFIKY